ncbi:DUF2004 domain-containing protein [Priestia megaterium]|uniref:DUF6985 domain-containing protein n=1 Tax=Priestia megaterium TaxID=1404 RepID=UPI000BF3330D|nr:DUF2004 domain-containing protein [Priestia megaterium]PEU58924.1 DUF2004 domain-containing protein [Priestia megaterium]
MTINDPIFGELEYEYGWIKDTTIRFFGKETQIALMIDSEEDGKFDENQYTAYQSFIKNWDDLQPSLLQSIVDYYKQKQNELGYDSGLNENYPLIETTGQILDMITFDGIVVPYADIFEGRDIRMTFNCTWDIENGLGIRLLNEKVIEVGYQDVAI